jgi:hypothetical protein
VIWSVNIINFLRDLLICAQCCIGLYVQCDKSLGQKLAARLNMKAAM